MLGLAGQGMVSMPVCGTHQDEDEDEEVEIYIQPLSAYSLVAEDKTWCPVKYYWHRRRGKHVEDQLFIILKGKNLKFP